MLSSDDEPQDVRWGFSQLFPRSCALRRITHRDDSLHCTVVYGEQLSSLEYLNLVGTDKVCACG